MNDDNADIEVVISGISPRLDGQTEKQRLDQPVRLKMIGGLYTIAGQAVNLNEFLLAVEMAKLRQLDRIADLIEKYVEKSEDKRQR